MVAKFAFSLLFETWMQPCLKSFFYSYIHLPMHPIAIVDDKVMKLYL